MHLRSLKLEKVHGILNVDIKFRPDITLLVGINGSGKTTILTCIESLLRPDFRRLAVLDYKRIELAFSHISTNYVLTATKSRDQASLSINGTEDKLPPFVIKINPYISPEDADYADLYNNLRPEPHERPFLDFLKSLPRPIFITLDRTMSAESEDLVFYEASSSGSQRRNQQRSAITHVSHLLSSAYSTYRKSMMAADDALKAKIVTSALQEPDILTQGKPPKPLTTEELNTLEHKVVSYFSRSFKSDQVTQQVRNFFEASKIASRRRFGERGQDLLLSIFSSRFRQIESLAKAFNDFESKNTAAFSTLGRFLNTVNRFFADSSKEIFFDESAGKLVFSFLNNGVRSDTRRSIAHLSSGERQILILFAFLAFAPSSSSSVFIVDEPELSLHPKWQHDFMDAFTELRPHATQLLLATHSPEIVGRHRSSCVTLRAGGQSL